MNYWIFTAKRFTVEGVTFTPGNILKRRLADKFWGLDKKTLNRKYLKIGDQIIFYLGFPDNSFVASATIGSSVFKLTDEQKKTYSHDKGIYKADYGVFLENIKVWEDFHKVKDFMINLKPMEKINFLRIFILGGERRISEKYYQVLFINVIGRNEKQQFTSRLGVNDKKEVAPLNTQNDKNQKKKLINVLENWLTIITIIIFLVLAISTIFLFGSTKFPLPFHSIIGHSVYKWIIGISTLVCGSFLLYIARERLSYKFKKMSGNFIGEPPNEPKYVCFFLGAYLFFITISYFADSAFDEIVTVVPITPTPIRYNTSIPIDTDVALKAFNSPSYTIAPSLYSQETQTPVITETPNYTPKIKSATDTPIITITPIPTAYPHSCFDWSKWKYSGSANLPNNENACDLPEVGIYAIDGIQILTDSKQTELRGVRYTLPTEDISIKASIVISDFLPVERGVSDLIIGIGDSPATTDTITETKSNSFLFIRNPRYGSYEGDLIYQCIMHFVDYCISDKVIDIFPIIDLTKKPLPFHETITINIINRQLYAVVSYIDEKGKPIELRSDKMYPLNPERKWWLWIGYRFYIGGVIRARIQLYGDMFSDPP